MANAGLIAPASVAARLGLKELLDETTDLGAVPGHANPGVEAMAVVQAVLAGADSIDDCDVLRTGAAGAGPQHPGAAFTIDVDSSIHETYGTKKEGASGFGYTHVGGYHPSNATTATGEVLHSRLRSGNAHTAHGAVSFLAESFSRVTTPGGDRPAAAAG